MSRLEMPTMASILRSVPHIRLVAAAASAFLILVAFMLCRPRPNQIPPREQHTLDSLAITKPIYEAHRDTLIRRETLYVRQSSEKARQSAQTAHAADSLRTIADVLQREAEAQRDTSSRWYGVAIARGIEADSLRSALSAERSALVLQTAAREQADARAAADSARVLALDRLSERLAADVKVAGQCRILGIARCPSRAVMAIGGAIVGAAVTYELTRR